MAGRKLFVGSLPQGIQEAQLRAEFGKFGGVEDIFVKQGCEPGRQWAFVTLSSPDSAQLAKDACDRILLFPGADRPCDVMVAKNQGMFGQEPGPGGSPPHTVPAAYTGQPTYAPAPLALAVAQPTAAQFAPRKIFVGSLPTLVTEADIRTEFSKYGTIIDIHINNKSVEAGRQWAFITFANSDQAQAAKVSADRTTVFPGSDKACEVTLARHQGMFGQEALSTDVHGAPVVVAHPQPVYVQPAMQGPKKIFVGSLPASVTNELLQAEFGRYGQVTDVHINYKACEPGRNWAFITFATPEQANYAKDATDRVLVVPGGDRPCEVMLAKNQGKNGQEPLVGAAAVPPGAYAMVQPAPLPMGHQPPPPSVPPPAGLTPWRMYKTAAGLPYYHNHSSGITQWECPPDLQVPGQGVYGAAVAAMPHGHYSPY